MQENHVGVTQSSKFEAKRKENELWQDKFQC